jgi:acetyltransferase-like isoleucine patch superfamily enzyme
MARSARIQLDPDGSWRGGNVEIADGSVISDGTILAPYRGRIRIGERVYVGPYCVLYGGGAGAELVVGRNTMIAAHCVIVPSQHGMALDRPMRDQPTTSAGICIQEDVWVGTGVRILDGVSIGKGAVIGAGAVVATSIPEYTIAAGVPARPVRQRLPAAAGQ